MIDRAKGSTSERNVLREDHVRAHTLRALYIGALMLFGALMNKGLTLKTGQTHTHRYMSYLLKKIERGDIDPSFVVTHRMSLDGRAQGLRDIPRQGGRVRQGRAEALSVCAGEREGEP
jgi:hypothetical protein